MTAALYLIPLSLALAVFAFAGFLWTIRNNQYEDLEGDSMRMLEADDVPLDRSSSLGS
ncbi:MAG: cbb3-type cytochrome oxidase assembly protein CcoS [Pseudomonadota bacterium]|nr:cbb3-type cytochrome oxidase assembly protein CcoS [Pseudomonadota bacterium]